LYLSGHSGGAQFVQRYALAHPERVAASVLSSAGWYTFPNPARADAHRGLVDLHVPS
jgi:pimeloyl-ACP methyl ester carboxylesterase